MATVARATHRVKSNVTRFLPERVIREAADAVGHEYRDRKLGPVRTVLLLVLQLLSANASLAHARALGGYAFSVSALCEARARLPLALLRRVLDWLVTQVAAAPPRVLLVDARSTVTRPTRRRYGVVTAARVSSAAAGAPITRRCGRSRRSTCAAGCCWPSTTSPPTGMNRRCCGTCSTAA